MRVRSPHTQGAGAQEVERIFTAVPDSTASVNRVAGKDKDEVWSEWDTCRTMRSDLNSANPMAQVSESGSQR
jgi:hypothetical protein